MVNWPALKSGVTGASTLRQSISGGCGRARLSSRSYPEATWGMSAEHGAIASQDSPLTFCFRPKEDSVRAIWNHAGIEVRPVPVFQENLTVYRRKVALVRGLELSGLLLAVSYEAACGLFLV